jgi:hypothetical protein
VRRERGQSTVEWVGLLLLVALLFASALAAGIRLPGASLAEALAARVLCAAALDGSCDDDPALVAAYGVEVAELLREHAPTLAFEAGSRAVPVDWRRCRDSSCGDAAEQGAVRRTDRGLPVTAFVHVVDCRFAPTSGETPEDAETRQSPDCSGSRAGGLYLQYWLYYADSATLRGVPVVGARGYHRDDWESVQVRIAADGKVDQRASSHHGYNYRPGVSNWASDAGFGPIRQAEEAVGARADNGWGPETGVLRVSGGSHAGNLVDSAGERFTPAAAIRLVPLEPIAAEGRAAFAVSSPWRKAVWRDPEAEGTS